MKIDIPEKAITAIARIVEAECPSASVQEWIVAALYAAINLGWMYEAREAASAKRIQRLEDYAEEVGYMASEAAENRLVGD